MARLSADFCEDMKAKLEVRMVYKDIKVVKNNASYEGLAHMIPDVTFSSAQGVDLKMQIFVPVVNENAVTKPVYPLIVYVQGNGWTYPDVYREIPQISQFARDGYVVATLAHRNCLEGHPFPAFLQDVKTGIRFLRKNSDKYHIDADRVAIWGISSGANAALLTGLTGNDPRYETADHEGFSDSVKVVVDVCGPVEFMRKLSNLPSMNDGIKPIYEALRGENTPENIERLMGIDAISHVTDGKEYPAFLLVHGDIDPIVDYSQSVKMYHRLCDAGAEASMVCVKGAGHEPSLWGREVLGLIKEFIDAHI